MNDYQKEQAESLAIVREYLPLLNAAQKETLYEKMADYFLFRERVGSFLSHYFGKLCSLKCYQNRLSACCGRDGIITFFADMVINALVSSEHDLERLQAAVTVNENAAHKCIYLGNEGCLWKLKPIVCEMFLCDSAMKEVFGKFPEAALKWQEFKEEEKRFKWPDRPVLFDYLEEVFLTAGYRSSLMYFHHSPGLLRIKQQAGLI